MNLSEMFYSLTYYGRILKAVLNFFFHIHGKLLGLFSNNKVPLPIKDKVKYLRQYIKYINKKQTWSSSTSK